MPPLRAGGEGIISLQVDFRAKVWYNVPRFGTMCPWVSLSAMSGTVIDVAGSGYRIRVRFLSVALTERAGSETGIRPPLNSKINAMPRLARLSSPERTGTLFTRRAGRASDMQAKVRQGMDEPVTVTIRRGCFGWRRSGVLLSDGSRMRWRCLLCGYPARRTSRLSLSRRSRRREPHDPTTPSRRVHLPALRGRVF